MSEAKKKVMALIKKRQNKNRRNRTKAAKKLGPNGIVLQFIKAMEKVVLESKGPLDFESGLEAESRVLHEQMRCLDPDVEVKIMWNKEDFIEDWKDLQVDGVHIKWSRIKRMQNPLAPNEMYIDVGQLFLEGALDDLEDSSED